MSMYTNTQNQYEYTNYIKNNTILNIYKIYTYIRYKHNTNI